MAIELDRQTRARLIESIQQYFREHMDDEIGELKAGLLLDFFVKELGPTVYNRAIADAQAQLQERVSELDGSCHETEFAYWRR